MPPQLIDLNGDGKTDLLCGIQVAYGNEMEPLPRRFPFRFFPPDSTPHTQPI